MPVVATQEADDCEVYKFHSEIQYMDEEEKIEARDELLADLEDAVADFNVAYNEATAEARMHGYGDEYIIESIEDYVISLFEILMKLQALGMNIETKIDAAQDMPLTTKVDGDTITLTASDGNPAKILLVIAAAAKYLKIAVKIALFNWRVGWCLVFPVCRYWTPDGARGDLFCGRPECITATSSAYDRFGP